MSKVKRIENRMVALADCTPHARNYNKHSDAQLKDLRELLKQFGQVRSAVMPMLRTFSSGNCLGMGIVILV
jgi:hypothetical protein